MYLLNGRSYLNANRSTCETVCKSPGFTFATKGMHFVYLGAGTVRCSCSRPIPSFGFVRGRLGGLSPRVRGAMFTVRMGPFRFMFGGGMTGVFRLCIGRFPGIRFYLCNRRRGFTMSSLFGSKILCFRYPYVSGHVCLLFAVGRSKACSCRAIRFWGSVSRPVITAVTFCNADPEGWCALLRLVRERRAYLLSFHSGPEKECYGPGTGPTPWVQRTHAPLRTYIKDFSPRPRRVAMHQ